MSHHLTSVYSADPISPNSSAPQLPNIIDLRGLHLSTSERVRDEVFNPAPCTHQSAFTFLTLLDHLAEHSRQLQHDGCPAARVDGSVNPAVPVVPVDHVPVCGQKHTHMAPTLIKEMNDCQWLIWTRTPVSPGSTLPLMTPITLAELFTSS